ncbi:MAG: STAS domain-containing protein [Moorellaceae bacterium]
MDIDRLEALMDKVAGDGRQRDLWRQLVEAALTGVQEERGVVFPAGEPLRYLLEELGEEVVADRVVKMGSELPSLPVTDMLLAIIRTAGEMRRERETVLQQLRQMLSELATPIIRIWKDILLVAMIGNIDSQRAQDIAEKLLHRVSSSRAKVVLVDVTGVPMIDTVVGGFLIEMFNAIKFLGAEVILTGIKPEVAHTLVKLGVDFRMVSIARDLEDALRQGIAITMEEKSRRRQLALSLAGDEPEESGENDGL